ncbi:MAG: hypothetical protein WCO31_03275 [Actinomycetes bacterium]
MAKIFDYQPHPRIAERDETGPVKIHEVAATAHGKGALGRLNAKVGLRITLVVGTMWAAYVFALIALLSLPQAITSHNLVIIIAWISSNFLQLVLLPVIIVGQNIQAKASDARSEATYNDAAAILDESRQIQAHLLVQDSEIAKLLNQVAALEAKLAR